MPLEQIALPEILQPYIYTVSTSKFGTTKTLDLSKVRNTPEDLLREQAKAILLKFGKAQVGEILLAPENVFFLMEHLFREFNKRKSTNRSMKFKHLLYAGMLLRYIRLPSHPYQTKKQFEQFQFKLYTVLGAKLYFADLVKHEPVKRFYADCFAVALENLIQLRQDWQNPRLNRLDVGLVANLAADHCLRISDLAVAITHGKRKIAAAELPRVARLLLEHPFYGHIKSIVDKQLCKSIQANYIKAVVILLAWCSPAYNSEYVNLVKDRINKLLMQNPALVAKTCANLLIQNQMGRYDHISNQDQARENLLFVIIRFLRASGSLEDKYAVLRLLKEGLTELEVKKFGNALTLDLNSISAYDYDLRVLKYIYDLRLGLWDIQHLNNQLQKICSRYDLKKKYTGLVPSVCNSRWFDERSTMGGNQQIHRKIAGLEYTCNGELDSAEETFDLKAFVLRGSLIAQEDDKQETALQHLASRCPATKIALSKAITDLMHKLVESGEDHNHLHSHETLRLSLRAIADYALHYSSIKGISIVGELHASIKYLGGDTWVYHEPSLPQGYIRFTRNQVTQLAAVILSCLEDLQPNMLKSSNLKADLIDLRPTKIVINPAYKVRRSTTPIQPEPNMSDDNPQGLHRSNTVPDRLSYFG